MSNVTRFPSGGSAAVWIMRETLGGWLVLSRDHGWLFGSYNEALDEARSLARSMSMQIREVA